MPPQRPKILYKYMSPSRAAEVCCSGRIYFPKSEKLNDPFDNSIQLSDKICPSSYIYQTICQYKLKNKTWAEIKDILDTVITEEVEISEKQKNIIDETYEKYLKSNSEQGILCLTEDPISLLMWAHYGISHTGVCIGFEVNSDNHLGDSDICDRVTYSDVYPEANFLEIMKRDGTLTQKVQGTKSIEWSYEKEWRLFLNEGNTLHDIPGRIAQVILGLNISPDETEKIKHIVQKTISNKEKYISEKIEIWKCVKANNRFEIELESV